MSFAGVDTNITAVQLLNERMKESQKNRLWSGIKFGFTRSRIEDADFALEQMNLVKAQIVQQTAFSSFSQANTAPQLVLSLFS